MNTEKLFGLKPNFITVAYSQFIKSAIFLRYGINSDEKIFLSSKPSPILKDLEIFGRGDGCQVDKGILVGTIRMGYGHHRMAYAVYSWVLAKKSNHTYMIFLQSNQTKPLPLKKLMDSIVR